MSVEKTYLLFIQSQGRDSFNHSIIFFFNLDFEIYYLFVIFRPVAARKLVMDDGIMTIEGKPNVHRITRALQTYIQKSVPVGF